MIITFFTIFPEYFSSVLQSSILKRAQEKSLMTFECVNIRDFAEDKHKMTDDRPFGGGAGMVMKIEPIDRAVTAWKKKYEQQSKWLVATSASGKKFTQTKATELATVECLGILCGHYEGIDQRVLDHIVDEEIRIGEYVLTGGEPAAVVMADVITRLIPGVLGNDESSSGESHGSKDQGAYPQYTRPSEYHTWAVPSILLGGDHAAIQKWREEHRQVIQD